MKTKTKFNDCCIELDWRLKKYRIAARGKRNWTQLIGFRTYDEAKEFIEKYLTETKEVA